MEIELFHWGWLSILYKCIFIFFAAFIVLKGVYSLPFHKQVEEVNRRNQLIFLVIILAGEGGKEG